MNSSDDSSKLEIELDNVMKNKNNEATTEMLRVCVPAGLMKRFP